MLDGRLRRKSRHAESSINYVNPMLDGRFQRREKRNLIEFYFYYKNMGVNIMTKSNIISYLNSLKKEELVLHIKKLYDIDRRNVDYLKSIVNMDYEIDILAKYKSQIEKVFKLKDNEVNIDYNYLEEIIKTFYKISNTPTNIADLMLYYVECGVDFTNKYGDIDEEYYDKIAYSFSESLKYIFKKNLQEQFENRCFKIHMKAERIGFGFSDYMSELYYAFYGEDRDI